MKYVFEWDPAKDWTNRAKHGVSFRQSVSVFRDPLATSIYDEDHSHAEDRWITMGQTRAGTLVVIVHTFRRVEKNRTIIRILSVRRATRSERRHYEESQ